MSNEQQSPEFQVQKEGLPGILGILTVLTMIGSVLGGIGSLFTGMGCKVLSMDAVVDKMKPEELAYLTATCEHKTVLMVSGVIGSVLCFAGAWMMRQLKKDGFIVYVAGQVLPLILTVITMSELLFKDWKSLTGYGLTALFIGLYLSQRKYLVK